MKGNEIKKTGDHSDAVKAIPHVVDGFGGNQKIFVLNEHIPTTTTRSWVETIVVVGETDAFKAKKKRPLRFLKGPLCPPFTGAGRYWPSIFNTVVSGLALHRVSNSVKSLSTPSRSITMLPVLALT